MKSGRKAKMLDANLVVKRIYQRLSECRELAYSAVGTAFI